MPRILTIVAAIAALIAVANGAFGAHALSDLATHQLEWWNTAAQYHMYHALGMFAAALVSLHFAPRLAAAAGWLFLLGIILFSGSLYTMALSERLFGEEYRWLGAVTPFGGVAFLLGWLLLAIAACFRR